MWKKYCRTGQATGGNIIQRMRILSCKTKAKNTHSENVIPIAFHCKICCTKAPQYYVIRTVPVVLLREICFELCKSYHRQFKISMEKDNSYETHENNTLVLNIWL